MEKRKIIGLSLIIIGLLLATTAFLIFDKEEEQPQEKKPNVVHVQIEELETIEPTVEQKEQGVKKIYNDSENGVLLIDK